MVRTLPHRRRGSSLPARCLRGSARWLGAALSLAGSRAAVGALLLGLGAGPLGCAEVRGSGPVAPSAPVGAAPAHVAASPTLAGGSTPAGGLERNAAHPTLDEGAVPVVWTAGHAAADDEEDEHDDHEEDDELGDDQEDPSDPNGCFERGLGLPPHCPHANVVSPAAGLSEAEIQRRVKEDLASLGPISLGAPNRGRLFNGVRFPEGEHWKLTDPGNAWGTQETVDSIVRAIDRVFRKYPDSHKVIVGHLSAKGGGRLRPHKSHQAGRDVDLSYFYTDKQSWYAVANERNLDRARTWVFVKAFLEDPNTEMILVDSSIQKLLREHALSIGEDPAYVDRVFQFGGKSARPLIRHVKGHATHIHVRFFSPVAQASGRLAEAYLPKPPPPPKREGKPGKQLDGAAHAKTGGSKGHAEDDGFVLHRARSGDTLDSLARRYGTTVAAIRSANGLKGNALKEKQTYRIPREGGDGGESPPSKGASSGSSRDAARSPAAGGGPGKHSAGSSAKAAPEKAPAASPAKSKKPAPGGKPEGAEAAAKGPRKSPTGQRPGAPEPGARPRK